MRDWLGWILWKTWPPTLCNSNTVSHNAIPADGGSCQIPYASKVLEKVRTASHTGTEAFRSKKYSRNLRQDMYWAPHLPIILAESLTLVEREARNSGRLNVKMVTRKARRLTSRGIPGLVAMPRLTAWVLWQWTDESSVGSMTRRWSV